ncbi:TRAP transporter substrate-binding protein [Alcaligenes endophyticus]|uniref:TRAP transporter substrate-binding protein n=1 Tax=Alcaligenes endophyticus TaxID=1929088 RepID=A0ABT8EI69_9BURK|nr:TRAP transporter substrate-binding protein [Alcaligenes endophyticus]MCX5592665.1 TRAP transporter substrate-binding protein [Alcaligenes endophyticus]MDN4120987.1 TRAP transporter substrate-binding protein [Alcaligenes endophyticus]
MKQFNLIKKAAFTLSALTCALSAHALELRMGHTGAPNHHYQQISEDFAKEVAKRTNGEITIAVFPSDQLGNQLESTEGVMIGTHDMVLSSDTVLSNWFPDMGILNLPFLINSGEEYSKVVEGPVGDQLAKQVESQGAVVIGWWENGLRHVTNSKHPITKPEDLNGLTIRVPEGEVFVDTFKALGAGPTVLSFGELYSALQLRTVDGQENPPAHIVTQNFNEVQPFASRTGHIHMGSVLLINKDLLERLPEDQRTVLVETAREFGPRHVQMVEALEAEQWAELERRGMKINDIEKAPFREKVQPVYEKAAKKMNADLIRQIEEQLAS